MMYGYYGDGGGYSLIGSFFMILFWIIIIVIIISLIRRSSHMHHWVKDYWGKDSNRSIDILKERYAKGEINKEEFEAKKKDLM